MDFNDPGIQPEPCECQDEAQSQVNDYTPQTALIVDPLQVYSMTLEAILQAQRQLLFPETTQTLFSTQSVHCRIPTSCPPGFQGRYTVRPGDTMFLIARRFGISLSSLISANPHITNPNLIFPCDVLCVPHYKKMTTEG